MNGIGHGEGDFTHDAVHIYKPEESSIHEHTRNQWYDTGYGQALVRRMQTANSQALYHTDEHRAAERANDGA